MPYLYHEDKTNQCIILFLRNKEDVLRVGLKTEYCKDDDLNEYSNVFWNLTDNPYYKEVLQERMYHWLWQHKYSIIPPTKKGKYTNNCSYILMKS